MTVAEKISALYEEISALDNERTELEERYCENCQERDCDNCLAELKERTGMSDTINRQDVIEKAHLPTIEDAGYEVIRLDYVLSLPSAKHRTGKWILWGGMDIPENHGRHKCSECREFALRWYDKPIVREHLSDFCPHCGADMRGTT